MKSGDVVTILPWALVDDKAKKAQLRGCTAKGRMNTHKAWEGQVATVVSEADVEHFWRLSIDGCMGMWHEGLLVKRNALRTKKE